MIQSGSNTKIVNQIVDALTFLTQNPDEKQKIIEAGIKTVENHDFNLVVNRFLDAIEN